MNFKFDKGWRSWNLIKTLVFFAIACGGFQFFSVPKDPECIKLAQEILNQVAQSEDAQRNIEHMQATQKSMQCLLPDTLLSLWHHTLGIQYYLADRYGEAAICFQKAIALRHNVPDLLLRSYNGLTQSALRNYDYSLAKQAIAKQLSMIQIQTDTQALGDLYFVSGELSFDGSDYDHAFDQLKLAEVYFKESNSENQGHLLNLLGAAAHQKGRYEQALGYYKQAETWYTQNDQQEELAKLYHKEAMTMVEIQAYQGAEINYKKAIVLNQKKQDTIELGRNYFEYARLLKLDSKLAESQKMVALSYYLRQSKLPKWHPDFVESGLAYIENLLLSKQKQEAKKLYLALKPSFDICPTQEMSIWSSDLALRISDEATETHSDSLISKYLQIDSLIQQVRQTHPRDASKIAFTQRIRGIYNRLAVKLAKAIQIKPNNAALFQAWFTITDHSKSVALTDELALKKKIEERNLPQVWISRKNSISMDLASTTAELLSKSDDNATTTLLRKVDSLQRALATMQNEIKDFASNENTNINTVVNGLSKNDALIDYFVADSTLQVLTCYNGKKNLTLKKLDIQSWEEWIINVSKGNQDTTLSRKLAIYFLGNLLPDLKKSQLNLFILPDASIGSLPFDALSLQDANDYLLYHATINIVTSVNQVTSKVNSTFDKIWPKTSAIFSLSYKDNQQEIAPLFEVSNETTKIKQILGNSCTVSEDSAATHKAFLQNLSTNQGIIHIGAHGFANIEQPLLSNIMLFHEKQKNYQPLTAAEIYGANSNAALIYLSACETGVGKSVRGEGILSLGRAFLYTGVQSQVITLWTVSDKSTAQIAENFYEHLKAGHTKPKALQLAKIEYMAQTKSAQALSPYYWGAQVVLGNPTPLYYPKFFYWFFGLMLLDFCYFFTKICRSKPVGVLINTQ